SVQGPFITTVVATLTI
nr:immunoglobulin heavy chain junction region [Mus musculus]